MALFYIYTGVESGLSLSLSVRPGQGFRWVLGLFGAEAQSRINSGRGVIDPCLNPEWRGKGIKTGEASRQSSPAITGHWVNEMSYVLQMVLSNTVKG